MTLSKEAKRRLIDAILSAFPSRTDLEELAEEIDVNLEERSPSYATSKESVRSLILWADSRGRVSDLVAAAKELNPGNVALQGYDIPSIQSLEPEKQTAAVSVCTITKRSTPRIGELIELLKIQTIQIIEYIIVDGYYHTRADQFARLIAASDARFAVRHLPPKPTRWGPIRPALANARNTCLLWAEGDLIVEIDDCCTDLPPDFLERHVSWSLKGYAASGSWSFNGFRDPRMDEYPQPIEIRAGQFYAGNRSFPLNKALEVNGYEELVDGEQGNDDIVFAYALEKAGVRFMYDPTLEVRFDPRAHTLTQLSPDPRKRRWGKEPWATSPKTRMMDDGTPHYANEWLAHEIFASGGVKQTGNKFVLDELRRLPKEAAGDIEAVQERLCRFVDPDPLDWRDGQPISEMVGGEFAYARDADIPLTSDPVRHADISKDNRQVAITTGKILRRRTLMAGKFEQIEIDVQPAGLVVTPRTNRLLIPMSRLVRIYGADLEESFDLRGNSDVVQTADCSADERYVAAGGWDASVHVWDFASRELVCAFKDLEDTVTTLGFFPDSSRLVGGTASGRLYLWDVELRGQLVTASLPGGSFTLIAPFVSGSTTWVLGGFSDGRVALIDLATSDWVQLAHDGKPPEGAGHHFEVTSGHVDDGGRYAITGCSAGDMIVWDLSRRSVVQTIHLACAPLAVKLCVAEQWIMVVTSAGQLVVLRVNPQFAGLFG